LTSTNSRFFLYRKPTNTSLESATLSLESDPENPEQIEAIFRAMHTLKGSGGMFGFDKISEFTHDLETIYDYVRRSTLKVNKHLLDITLQSVDHLKELINQGDNLDQRQLENHRYYTSLIKEFATKNIYSKQPVQTETNHASEPAKSHAGNQPDRSTYYISFKPNEDADANVFP